MKLKLFTTLTLVSILTAGAAAQNINRLEKGQTPPDGVVIYSLPTTVIRLSVEAVCETYTPGPYSQWAKKYLGIDVPQEAGSTYTLSRISMTPYIEADRSCSYIVNLDGLLGDASPASFFEFSSQGLLVLSDENKGRSDAWRFPSIAPGQEDLGSGATSNLTSTETTLYRTVRNESGGYDRVAVRQSQVVEKSPEKKAAEAASMILSLRQSRIDIITGNTDATFSGDALRAAIDEISRLEEEYMSLFTGTRVTSTQTKSFDVVPEAGKEEELTIAFRISDTQGLLPSDNVSGRPIVMETVPEDNEDFYTEQVIDEAKASRARAKYEAATRGDIYYRVPGICTVRVIDGQDLILESRVPVYQKGQELSFPISVIVK
ncbi:MAG TPA: DUF4831 family protein [Candidatus Coprenecus merdigallinarum]|nr:DUF4831 family protein [Candidatus Coprenecus merdigallinarum]